jgi:hypothetical protein
VVKVSSDGGVGHLAASPEASVEQTPSGAQPKWRRTLEKELAHVSFFEGLTEGEWRQLVRRRRVTSINHDTVLSLDWPHYCAGATMSCGGPKGWCYTFNGHQTNYHHMRKVAMVDVLARTFPRLLAEKVAGEVTRAVANGTLPYPNLRYSGSGEVNVKHIPALELLAQCGIRLWGFSRNIIVARALRDVGASVIFSCDKSTPQPVVAAAMAEGLPLSYSSEGVDDVPQQQSVVVFPIHRSGRVQEVVDLPELCPKVVHEYLHHERPRATCQTVCHRCHQP